MPSTLAHKVVPELKELRQARKATEKGNKTACNAVVAEFPVSLLMIVQAAHVKLLALTKNENHKLM
jgi:hypothetical protein